MSEFVPELGQAAFSNTPWRSLELTGAGENALTTLADFVAEHQGMTKDKYGYRGLLVSNVGGEFVNETFAMRAYCWCDGEMYEGLGGGMYGHLGEAGCPPNFEHFPSGVTVSWYKHVGRSASISRKVDHAEWLTIVVDCVESMGWRR